MLSSLARCGLLATTVIALTGCLAAPMEGEEVADVSDENVADSHLSFEAFEAGVYQEPESGVYIVDGDTPIENREQLLEYYEENIVDGALAVHVVDGSEDHWGPTHDHRLTYCVSSKFGARHGAVVQAMANAAAAWESAADVNFIHVAAEDAGCSSTSPGVVFDVSPTSNAPYLARAFFPHQSRATRNVMIDGTAFGHIGRLTLAGILRHELGHALGFRHEHTRPEASASQCFEDDSWHALTPYDARSVMHYPQCNGSQTGDLVLTKLDFKGARLMYGAPSPRTR